MSQVTLHLLGRPRFAVTRTRRQYAILSLPILNPSQLELEVRFRKKALKRNSRLLSGAQQMCLYFDSQLSQNDYHDVTFLVQTQPHVPLLA